MFESLKIKRKKKKNITQQNYKSPPKYINKLFQWDKFRYLFEKKTKQKALTLSWETIQVTPAATSITTHCIVVHITQSKNSEPSENFAILKKCPRKLNYLIFEILLIKKKRPDIKLTEHYSIS